MRYLLITTLLIKVLLISAVSAQLVEVHIENPGKAGMVSAIGASDYTPDMLRYALNVTYRDGRLRPRMSVDIYGGTNIAIYGASGYYDPYTQTKNIFGVGAVTVNDTYFDTTNTSTGSAPDCIDTVVTEYVTTFDSYQFYATDTFKTSIQENTLDDYIYVSGAGYHDWTPHREILIHADGSGVPQVLTTVQGFFYRDSVIDTLGYEPRAISLGLEAPGQLGVMVLDETGPLNGKYQYKIAFQGRVKDSACGGQDLDWWVFDSTGPAGLASVMAYPVNQRVILTKFENMMWFDSSAISNGPDTNGTLRSTHALILRKQFTGKGEWFVIDTVIYDIQTPFVYVDSLPDTVTTVQDTLTITDDIRMPGRIRFARVGDSISTDTSDYAYNDSTYHIAYTFYDKELHFESRLGPPLTTRIDTATAANMLKAMGFNFAYVKPDRPQWIRIYQSMDSLTWYCLFEIRTNRIWTDSFNIQLGEWTDVDVVVGLSAANINIDDSINGADTVDGLYDWMIPVTAVGVSISVDNDYQTCFLPFTDIAKAHDKFYAIGDPEFPNRIYYSRFDTAWVWPAINFYRIDESVSDEFVALEEFRGMLYAFKHNSIWVKPEGDAEWDMYWGRTVDPDIVWRQLTAELGAASRNTVLKHGDAIYFMTPSADVYVIGVDGLHEISGPVKNWMDTTFRRVLSGGNDWSADYTAVKRLARLISLNDDVKCLNDSTGWFMSYNTKRGTWTSETIRLDSTTIFAPLGSFAYDSLSGSAGFGDNADILFIDTTIGLSYQKRTSIVGDWVASGGPASFSFQWVAEFPLGGDGVWLWAPQVFKPTFFPRTQAWLRFDVYDEDGTRKAQDSVYLTTAPKRGTRYHITPSNGVGYPFVRIWSRGSGFSITGATGYSPGGDTQNPSDPTVYANIIEFDKIVFFIENVGQHEVE